MSNATAAGTGSLPHCVTRTAVRRRAELRVVKVIGHQTAKPGKSVHDTAVVDSSYEQRQRVNDYFVTITSVTRKLLLSITRAYPVFLNDSLLSTRH